MTNMDMKLEVVVLPVSDVDRAKAFYAGLGWREDADFTVDEGYRVVQFTPPGSAASVIFGAGQFRSGSSVDVLSDCPSCPGFDRPSVMHMLLMCMT